MFLSPPPSIFRLFFLELSFPIALTFPRGREIREWVGWEGEARRREGWKFLGGVVLW